MSVWSKASDQELVSFVQLVHTNREKLEANLQTREQNDFSRLAKKLNKLRHTSRGVVCSRSA